MQGTALKPLCALLAIGLGSAAAAASEGGPPRFHVPASEAGRSTTFVVYGDTRFTAKTGDMVNVVARRALVEKIATENPAAIFIGGDLVYSGASSEDYDTFKSETQLWANRRIAVFPALGNHEFMACPSNPGPCLENWWNTFATLRPYRWYSVSVGDSLLALVLDSDSALVPRSEQRTWFEQQIAAADPHIKFILVVLHYPPVRDPLFPRMRDEQEVARVLSARVKSLHAQPIVVGSHVHNYERYSKDGIEYLVSGGGGAQPHPAPRMFGEQSRLKTGVNFHYLRFILESEQLQVTMVRFAAEDPGGKTWTEPDHFEVRSRN
jgi:calcineurin-like phosphoesterase family protein